MNKNILAIGIILLIFEINILPSSSGYDNKVSDTLNFDIIPNSKIQQNLFGNPPEEEWNITYGGSVIDQGQYVQQTNDNGYIIVGHTESFGAGNYDIWLIKTDSNGNEQWNKTFGGSNHDFSNSIQQTTDGGYIILGDTYSYDKGSGDIWLIKIDSNGNEQWNKTFGGANADYGSFVQQTDDEGYIFVGGTSSYGYSSTILWLIKTDSNGNEQWNKTYGGSDTISGGEYVQQTSDSGYIITGSFMKGYYPALNVWLIKTNTNGVKEWEREFGDLFDEWGTCVRQTSDGGYIIAGYKENDFWLIKTDSLGFEQWNKLFDYAQGQDNCYSVQETYEGGYILVGSAYEPQLQTIIWLVKTNADGNMLWDKTLGEVKSNGYCIQQTYDRGYIIVGAIKGQLIDIWLIKLESEGIPEAPNISGNINGNVGMEYEYRFNATDPDEDEIFYFIDWDDGSFENWIGPFPSAEEIKVNHTWTKKATYTINAKVKDTNGRISPEGTLEVSMPRRKALFNLFIPKFLVQFQNIFRYNKLIQSYS